MKNLLNLIGVFIAISISVSFTGCKSETFEEWIPDILKPDTIDDDTATVDTGDVDTIVVDTLVNDTTVIDTTTTGGGSGGDDTGGSGDDTGGDDTGGGTGGGGNSGGGDTGGGTGGGGNSGGGDTGGGTGGGGNSGGGDTGGGTGGGGNSGGGDTGGGGGTGGSTTTAKYIVLSKTNYTSSGLTQAMLSMLTSSLESTSLYRQLINWINSRTSSDLVVTKVVLKYPTVDCQGKTTYLSGVIYLPYGKNLINEIVVSSHMTVCSNDESPTGKKGEVMEANLVSTNKDVVVISSDYLGYGITGDKIHPYLAEEAAGHWQLDLAKAGMQYMKDNHISISSNVKTYSVGFSQGGAVAVATQRAFEQDSEACKKFNFRGTYCGDGPYDPWATFEYYMDRGTVEMPTVLPMSLMGMMAAHPDVFKGIKFEDYFSSKINTTKLWNLIADKKTNILSIDSEIKNMAGSNKTVDIMSKAALDKNSTIMKALRKALDRENLADGSWRPQHKCVVFHARNDNVVPYVNSRNLKSAFNSSMFVDATPWLLTSESHIVAALTFYIGVITQNKYRVD